MRSFSTAALGEIVVSWHDASAKEASYEVEFGTQPNVWQPLTKTAANVTSVHHSNVEFDVTYYYRVRACNTDGCSAWVTTSTAWKSGEPPTAQPPIASSIGLTFATLTSQVDIGGIRTEVYFILYDPVAGVQSGAKTETLSFSSLDGNTGRLRQVSLPVIGLHEGTTYGVVAVATNPAGTVTSPPITFTTSKTGPPTFTLVSATVVRASTASLGGTIDPGGSATTYSFQLAAADSSFASGSYL
jgi:hypothetical protein